MKTYELLNHGSNKLKLKKIISHKLDSEILLSKVLKINREQVLINLDKNIAIKNINKFNRLITRRLRSEPVAYIVNEKEFWSKNFKVDKYTLIPRPETELMVEKLVKLLKKKTIQILDIGTGSGCILISLLTELDRSKGVGIDISSKALMVAKSNALKHNVSDNAKFKHRAINDFCNKKFDLIVSNPPYIDHNEIKNLDTDIKKYEPKVALDGGNDGLDVIKKVIYKAKEILKRNGLLAIEIGNGQNIKVSNILIKNFFKIEHKIKDYKSNTRCIISRLIY